MSNYPNETHPEIRSFYILLASPSNPASQPVQRLEVPRSLLLLWCLGFGAWRFPPLLRNE